MGEKDEYTPEVEPKVEEVEVKELTEEEKVLLGKKHELDALTLDEQIVLKKASIKDTEELTQRKTENEAQAKANSTQAEANEEQRQVNETKRQENEVEESDRLSREEHAKSVLVGKLAQIKRDEKTHIESMARQDTKRQETHKKHLTYVDSIASKVYNASTQDITNRLREDIVKNLKPLMESFGITPSFDTKNAYISLGDETYFNIKVKDDGRDIPYVPSESEMPENIKKSYQVCLGIYNYLKDEPRCGVGFCQRIYKTLEALQGLVKGKEDDAIMGKQEEILVLLHQVHQTIMSVAESYQDIWQKVSLLDKIMGKKHPDYVDMAEYLVESANKLEIMVNVGITPDRFEISSQGGRGNEMV